MTPCLDRTKRWQHLVMDELKLLADAWNLRKVDVDKRPDHRVVDGGEAGMVVAERRENLQLLHPLRRCADRHHQAISDVHRCQSNCFLRIAPCEGIPHRYQLLWVDAMTNRRR